VDVVSEEVVVDVVFEEVVVDVVFEETSVIWQVMASRFTLPTTLAMLSQKTPAAAVLWSAESSVCRETVVAIANVPGSQ
jgi:hypothetical protein